MTNVRATEELVAFTKQARFETLDPETVRSTKRVILDTIGCAVGGHATQAAQMLLKVKRSRGGTPEASIIGTNDRSSATSAAFVNCELANLLDADETLLMIAHHANCIVAAGLAVGELVGANGRDLIASIAVGYDLAARVGLSLDVMQEPGIRTQFSPLSGNAWIIFGCTSTAGQLLGLSEDELMNAFGIAATCAPIPYLGRWERTPPTNRPMTKYAFYGPLTENGILAALLAKEGFVGDKDVLDGDVGFWRLSGAKACKWGLLTNDLGKKWWINDTSFKAIPGCRHISITIDLLSKIMIENHLSVDEIDGITIWANPVLSVRGFDSFPKNEVDMVFSVPYLVSVAAVENFRASPTWVAPYRLKDERIRRLASKIKLAVHPKTAAVLKEQLDRDGVFTRVPTEMEVFAKGKTFVAASEYAKGDPWTPESCMTDAELAQKFRYMAGELLGQARTDAAIRKMMSLEGLDRVDDLMLELTNQSDKRLN